MRYPALQKNRVIYGVKGSADIENSKKCYMMIYIAGGQGPETLSEEVLNKRIRLRRMKPAESRTARRYTIGS